MTRILILATWLAAVLLVPACTSPPSSTPVSPGPAIKVAPAAPCPPGKCDCCPHCPCGKKTVDVPPAPVPVRTLSPIVAPTPPTPFQHRAPSSTPLPQQIGQIPGQPAWVKDRQPHVTNYRTMVLEMIERSGQRPYIHRGWIDGLEVTFGYDANKANSRAAVREFILFMPPSLPGAAICLAPASIQQLEKQAAELQQRIKVLKDGQQPTLTMPRKATERNPAPIAPLKAPERPEVWELKELKIVPAKE